MSETHTPGPWFQSHREKPNGMFSTEVYDKDGQVICALAWHAVPTATGITTDREPNARLISAAPDLLAALKALVRVNEEWNAVVESSIGRPPNWTDGYLDSARAAIAKAEGRS